MTTPIHPISPESEPIALTSPTQTPHRQAMALVQAERELRQQLRSLTWTELRLLDIKRIARATQALESDVLFARVLVRAAVAKQSEQKRPLQRQSARNEEDDAV